MFLLRVTSALDEAGISYALVGGCAVALHGAVRGTVDVDLVLRISRKQFVAFEQAMQSIGLVSRLPVSAAEVFQFRAEYIANRNLRAWSFVNPDTPSEIVDVIITHDLADMKAHRIKVGKQWVRVLAIPDLIRMKQEAGRPQDLADVAALQELP